MPDPEPYICLRVTTDRSDYLQYIFDTFDVEGLESLDDGLKGFWPKSSWMSVEKELMDTMDQEGFTEIELETIPFVNWNASWESNFQPIHVPAVCYIRAPFHPPSKEDLYDIVIDPKMAFGTGHHATTYQMIEQMALLELQDNSVLDLGCGTGILAIVAKKMGAARVLAIDNDKLAVENTKENMLQNDERGIEVEHAGVEDFHKGVFDILLANINRNVLLASTTTLKSCSATNSQLLVSGFYEHELPTIQKAYQDDWAFEQRTVKDGWCCARFQRK